MEIYTDNYDTDRLELIIDSYAEKETKAYEKACTLYCNQIAKAPNKRAWESTEKKIKALLAK